MNGIKNRIKFYYVFSSVCIIFKISTNRKLVSIISTLGNNLDGWQKAWESCATPWNLPGPAPPLKDFVETEAVRSSMKIPSFPSEFNVV